MMHISCSVSHTAPTAEFERIFISFLLKPLPWEFGRSACPSPSSKFVRTSGFTEIVVSTSPVLRFRLESTFCDISGGGLLLKRCMLAEIITVSNHKGVFFSNHSPPYYYLSVIVSQLPSPDANLRKQPDRQRETGRYTQCEGLCRRHSS